MPSRSTEMPASATRSIPFSSGRLRFASGLLLGVFLSAVFLAGMKAGASSAGGPRSTTPILHALIKSVPVGNILGTATCPSGWIASGGGFYTGNRVNPGVVSLAQPSDINGRAKRPPTEFRVSLVPPQGGQVPASARSYVVCLELSS